MKFSIFVKDVHIDVGCVRQKRNTVNNETVKSYDKEEKCTARCMKGDRPHMMWMLTTSYQYFINCDAPGHIMKGLLAVSGEAVLLNITIQIASSEMFDAETQIQSVIGVSGVSKPTSQVTVCASWTSGRTDILLPCLLSEMVVKLWTSPESLFHKDQMHGWRFRLAR